MACAKAAIIGGGGGARAAIRYLADAGAAEIALILRSPDKAERLRGVIECTLDLARIRMLSLHDLSGDGLVLPALYTRSSSLQGQRYRSHVVIRVSGRRRTEAFLFAWEQDRWHPVVLADGTVSDGKIESYARCVESLCGSADTFFTSVFSAQGQLSMGTRSTTSRP